MQEWISGWGVGCVPVLGRDADLIRTWLLGGLSDRYIICIDKSRVFQDDSVVDLKVPLRFITKL